MNFKIKRAMFELLLICIGVYIIMGFVYWLFEYSGWF